MTAQLAALCRDNCPTAARPFSLTLANDFQETANPDQLRLPSPRLVGLDATGAPPDLFWELLDGRLADRFARLRSVLACLGAAFPSSTMKQPRLSSWRKTRTSPLSWFTWRPTSPPSADLAGLDAVGAPPTADLLAAGAVHDLTDMMQTDIDFDRADFYEQLWQGTWWRERMWFMPLAGRLNVLYYDKNGYRDADQPEPTLRWTWQEMMADMTAVAQGSASPDGRLAWGFLDVGPDALFSYAYNWNNTCAEATVRCDQPLTAEAVAAALGWYHSLAGQPGQMPDFTPMSGGTGRGALQLAVDPPPRRHLG